MFMKEGLSRKLTGALGLSLFAACLHLPAQAQNAVEEETQLYVATDTEQLATYPVSIENEPVVTQEAAQETIQEPEKLAQARRRTRNAARGSNFIGIGADFGTADDFTFAAISKFALNDRVALRPSALIGDDFAVLVPVTYEFNQYAANVQGFQLRPYAGVGASYTDSDDDSNFGLLLSAGLDVPLSRRFTGNAQVNYSGVFSDDDNFGVTVGVGYNVGNSGLR